MKEKKWNIIAKHLSHEQLNDEETKYVETEKSIVDECNDSLKDIDLYLALYQFDSKKAWKSVDKQTHQARILSLSSWSRRDFVRIAAFAFLFVALGFSLVHWAQQYGDKVSSQIVEAKEGAVSFSLPDGSKVVLREGSFICFPEKFSGQTRNVKLTGEAFFDIEPNKDIPFIIDAGEAKVRVVGTSFNVNTLGNSSKCIEVAVQTGRVELFDAKVKDRKIVLDPGNIGSFDPKTQNLIRKEGFDPNIMAWRTFDLFFNNTSIVDVFAMLSDVYGVTFDLSEINGMKERKLTARYKQQSLDSILKLLELSHKLSPEKIGDKSYRIFTLN